MIFSLFFSGSMSDQSMQLWSHPDLTKYGLALNTRLEALICLTCADAVLPGFVHDHLKARHSHGHAAFTQDDVDDAIADHDVHLSWDALAAHARSLRTRAGELVEFEALETVSVLACSHEDCHNGRVGAESMQKHWRKYHPQAVQPQEWPTALAQRLNHASQPFFIVSPSHDLSEPTDKMLEEMAAFLVRCKSDPLLVDEDNRVREPWLVRTRFDEFVKGKDPRDLIEYTAYPDNKEFPGLRVGVIHFATRIDDDLNLLSDLVKQNLNTEEDVLGYVFSRLYLLEPRDADHCS